jgi:conjugal transfer pilus assembly protein TraV
MTRRRLLIAAASSLLAGCATLGSTVKGSFDCRAPEGSCAPTSAIDATVAAAEARADTLTRPRSSGSGVPRPARTGERTVTIHFPAFIDARGVLHEEAVAHAVVEGPAWAISPNPHARFSRSPAPSSLREAVAGASAPAIEGLESLPAQAPHPISTGHPADVPGQAALDAARAGHRIGERAVAVPRAPRRARIPQVVPGAKSQRPESEPQPSQPVPNGATSQPPADALDLSELLTVTPATGEPR